MPVAFEEASEKFTPDGEGVAPNGWADPASTENGPCLISPVESELTIVFSPMGTVDGKI